MRETLTNVWKDFTENYLTISTYANDKDLTKFEAEQLLKLAALVVTNSETRVTE